MISDLERLVAIDAIQQLRARFARALDTQDWAAFQAVFAPDAVLDATSEGDAGGRRVGPEAITAFISTSLAEGGSVHHAHMPEIELTSPITARGIWAMEDWLDWPAEAAVAKSHGFRKLHGYGHYHEIYERVEGVWLVKSFTLKRLRVDVS